MRTPQLNANSQRRNKFALGINERNDIVFPLIGFLISFLYNGVCACKFLDSIWAPKRSAAAQATNSLTFHSLSSPLQPQKPKPNSERRN